MSALRQRLNERRVLVMDGAMGSMPPGARSTHMSVANPV